MKIKVGLAHIEIEPDTSETLELNRMEGQTIGEVIDEAVRYARRKDYFV